jgi:ketol-acid reductoisomerase
MTTTTATLSSTLFSVEQLELAGTTERFVRGGRRLFPLLPKAFAGIENIAVLGWGSQARAQAQNLRDALRGIGIRVCVGLRAGSTSLADARAAGFSEDDGTLGELFDVCGRADLALLLIADAAQAELHSKVFGALRPGAALGLSHGFLAAHLDSIGEGFPDHIDVIAACPKGMGPSVRRLFEQGAAIDGAGINASVAVEQDRSGRATDRALGWAVGIGAPAIFATTLRSECTSDVFGERGILLGAVHGIVESLYRRLIEADTSPEEAFERACDALTGPLRRTISRHGLLAVRAAFDPRAQATFDRAYAAAHRVATPILHEIYDEVASGNEIRSVIAAQPRLERFPMTPIEGGAMWRVGAEVRRTVRGERVEVDPFTAGTFVGVMVAQVDVLAAHGHPWSEIANETVIEAVDSLLPYMHARGVAYMVDNCSTTARLGARRWAPRFEFDLGRIAYPMADGGMDAVAAEAAAAFGTHAIHGVLAALRPLRPTVDIAVD